MAADETFPYQLPQKYNYVETMPWWRYAQQVVHRCFQFSQFVVLFGTKRAGTWYWPWLNQLQECISDDPTAGWRCDAPRGPVQIQLHREEGLPCWPHFAVFQSKRPCFHQCHLHPWQKCLSRQLSQTLRNLRSRSPKPFPQSNWCQSIIESCFTC